MKSFNYFYSRTIVKPPKTQIMHGKEKRDLQLPEDGLSRVTDNEKINPKNIQIIFPLVWWAQKEFCNPLENST